MGGEPTFVSIDDYQSAEWNTAALGPTKRARADELIRRLRDRFAPGGLLHYGQGKWYPGEPLPRWAFALFWRKRRQADLAERRADRDRERRAAAPSTDDAQRFTEALAARLGIAAELCAAGLRGSGRPDAQGRRASATMSIRPIPRSTTRSSARASCACSSGISSAPAGYVLPVQRWTAQASAGWISEIWQTAPRRLFLVPGDSPIGFRLPLNSLPYVAPNDEPHLVPADPFAERGALPDPARRTGAPSPAAAFAAPPLMAGVAGASVGADRADRATQPSPPVRTALDGRAARRQALRVHAAGRTARGLSRSARRGRGDGRRAQPAGPRRRLSAAARSAPERHQGDARSRRHRGQHPSGGVLARGGRHHAHALRGGASLPARRRQVHDRRPPHRHRRRQSRRARRRRPRPTARSCAGPTC